MSSLFVFHFILLFKTNYAILKQFQWAVSFQSMLIAHINLPDLFDSFLCVYLYT